MNLNLVGRETDLVGRETGAPQRIWDSSIFTGRVGRYNVFVMWVPESLQGLSLPASPCWGASVAHSWKHPTGSCLWLPHEQWLGLWKHEKHAVGQHVQPSSWSCMGEPWGQLASPLRFLLLSYRTPWKLPIERRKERALREKPVKEERKYVS